MNGLFIILFGICVARGLWALDEEQCSKYHYEEQILSKQIRMEIRLENLENILKNIQQEEVKTKCDDEWIPFESSCYQFGTVSANFDQAESFCKTSGGHLVDINNSRESDFIKRHVAMLSAPNFWIGLTDRAKEGVWKWAHTDQISQFFNWNKGEPNGRTGCNCAAIFENYGNNWVDEPCTNRQFSPICKK